MDREVLRNLLLYCCYVCFAGFAVARVVTLVVAHRLWFNDAAVDRMPSTIRRRNRARWIIENATDPVTKRRAELVERWTRHSVRLVIAFFALFLAAVALRD